MNKTTSQDKINQEIHDGLEEQFAMERGEHTTYKEIEELNKRTQKELNKADDEWMLSQIDTSPQKDRKIEEKSDCCNADVKIVPDVLHHYECKKCGKTGRYVFLWKEGYKQGFDAGYKKCFDENQSMKDNKIEEILNRLINSKIFQHTLKLVPSSQRELFISELKKHLLQSHTKAYEQGKKDGIESCMHTKQNKVNQI